MEQLPFKKGYVMQLVTTIIKPHKLEDVKAALIKSGVAGMTISEVKGFGRQKGHTETYRGSEYEVDVIRRIHTIYCGDN